MIGNHDDLIEVDEFDDELDEDLDDLSTDDDPDTGTANVGETSVEINVEELIAEIEAETGIPASSRETDPRKRLEMLLEERRIARELEEYDEFELDALD